MNDSKYQKKGGFTIIETLVAIAILMISIAGPLVVANKALTASLYAKDQSTASFLAQEGMESIRNLKDNYVYNNPGGFANLTLSSGLFGSCVNGNANSNCGIWFSDENGSVSAVPCNGLNSCLLYQSGDFGYMNSSDSSLTKTKFTRYFYVTHMAGNSDELQVTVVVTWNEGNVPSDMILRSQITAKII